MKTAQKKVTEETGRTDAPRTTRIIADPVVSCRPEEDGALLFNPDTDSTVLINSTGLIVWKFLKKPRTIAAVAVHLIKTCSDIQDRTAVSRDVDTFVQDLSPDFIVQEPADAKKPAAR